VRGIFHIKLTWIDSAGNRGRKSVTTGLPVKGNRKRAEELVHEAKKEQEAILKNMPRLDNFLFADFLEEWLEAIRHNNKKPIKLTTFGGYQMNVQKIIAPYFRKKRILLCELTADDINDCYEDQLERVKAMTVTMIRLLHRIFWSIKETQRFKHFWRKKRVAEKLATTGDSAV